MSPPGPYSDDTSASAPVLPQLLPQLPNPVTPQEVMPYPAQAPTRTTRLPLHLSYPNSNPNSLTLNPVTPQD